MEKIEVYEDNGKLFFNADDVLEFVNNAPDINTAQDDLRVLVMTATELTTTETR